MSDTHTIQFCPLFSGSSGNATFVGCGRTKILVDCGESGRSITEALGAVQVDPNELRGIFLTHAHNDHIRGAGVMSRRYDLPIYASVGTWAAIQRIGVLGDIPVKNIKVFQTALNRPFDLGDMEVTWFPIPHDVPDPVGFRFSNDYATAAVATDIGHVSREVQENLTGATVVLLESNHDVQMLRTGPYTEYLKRRILSNFGHLSNDNAGIFAEYLLKKGTDRIYLGHLSHENNTPELAYDTVTGKLDHSNVHYSKLSQILMANRRAVSQMTVAGSAGCQ